MYMVVIKPAINGWIVECTFEGHVLLVLCFLDPKDVANFLNKELPKLKNGFHKTLKKWIGEGI
jgi:hypothetical protein